METTINDALKPYVSVNTQTFTDTQKAQARSNIGAGTSSFSGNYNDLTNKPTIPTVDQAVSNTSTNPVANKAITDYVDQAKEDIEGQIPTDYVAYTAQQLTDEQKQQARSNIGAGTSSFSGNYNDLTNKPTIPVVDQSLNASSTNAVANKPVAEAINLINTDLDAIEAGAVRADISQSWTAEQQAQARTNIGAGTGNSNFSGNYNDLTNKPTIPTEVVRYVTQTLTEDQKNQARTNIGAGTSSFSGAYDDLTGAPSDLLTYSEQALTSEQQAQVRTNIGAGTSSFSGSYTDLTNKPDIPANVVQYVAQSLNASEKQQARTNIGAGTSNFSGSYNDLTNKPAIPTNVVQYTAQSLNDTQKSQARTNIGAGTGNSNFSGAYDDLTGKPVIDTAMSLESTNAVQNKVISQFIYDGIQEMSQQVDTKLEDYVTTLPKTYTENEKEQVRTNIGAGTSNFSGSYTDLTNKPTIPNNVVQYVPQELTAEDQAQARKNISAGTSNFSGSYNDLNNKPTIPTNVVQYTTQTLTTEQQAQARANIGAGTGSSDFSGNYNDLTNKPDIPTKTSDLTNDSTFQTSAQLAEATNGAVVNVAFNEANGVFTFTRKDGSTFTLDTNLEKIAVNFTYDAATKSLVIHYADGTTENIPLEDLITEYTGSTGTDVDITITTGTDSSIIGASLKQTGTLASYAKKTDLPTNYVAYTAQTLSDAQKQQARTNIGAGTGTSNFSGNYNDLTNKPTIDTSLNNTSLNAVTNKAVTEGIQASSDDMMQFVLDKLDHYVGVSAQTFTDEQKAQARANIGAGTGNSNFSGNYNDLTNKPTIPTNYVTIDTHQNITAGKEFNLGNTTIYIESAGVTISDGNGQATYSSNQIERNTSSGKRTLNYPDKTGILAITSDYTDVLRYSAQTLNDTQKSQARTNIGAGTSNFSGSYTDLTNKPVIPTNVVLYTSQSLEEAQKQQARTNIGAGTSSFSGSYNDLTDKPSIVQNVVQYVAQSLSASQQAQARTNIGAGTSSFSGSYNDLTNKPVIPTDYIKYTQQTLTTAQQQQARANIGAGTSNFDGKYTSLTDTPEGHMNYLSDWSATVTYNKNDAVNYYGILLLSKVDGNLNHTPNTDVVSDDYWQNFNFYSIQNQSGVTTSKVYLTGSVSEANNSLDKQWKNANVYMESGVLYDSRGAVMPASENGIVKYTAQSKTDNEKQIARNNIGAGTSNFSGNYSDLANVPALPVYRDTWSDTYVYEPNDLVRYNGFIFFAVAGGSGNKPDITKDTDYWRRLNYGATGVTNTTTTAAYWLLGTTSNVSSPSDTAGLYKRSTVYVDTSGYLRDARGLVAANSSLSDVLRYSAQTLTAEQQAQVKTNLGITDGGGAWDDITGKPEGLLNYKGTYVTDGTYDKNDVVEYTSFYYISLVDNNTNDIPTVGSSNSY